MPRSASGSGHATPPLTRSASSFGRLGGHAGNNGGGGFGSGNGGRGSLAGSLGGSRSASGVGTPVEEVIQSPVLLLSFKPLS